MPHRSTRSSRLISQAICKNYAFLCILCISRCPWKLPFFLAAGFDNLRPAHVLERRLHMRMEASKSLAAIVGAMALLLAFPPRMGAG
jgi:hypothetical protein